MVEGSVVNVVDEDVSGEEYHHQGDCPVVPFLGKEGKGKHINSLGQHMMQS